MGSLPPSFYSTQNVVNILKELYARDEEYYDVEGAKEELIRRIKELPKVEKVLYGINEEDL